jgi:hypothetical protein
MRGHFSARRADQASRQFPRAQPTRSADALIRTKAARRTGEGGLQYLPILTILIGGVSPQIRARSPDQFVGMP